jgi:DNA-binding NtrC family response regulator
LLRALEDHRFRRLGGVAEVQVDVRVLAASNQDLQLAVAQNRFRLDLLYRLNVVTVKVPPLRERGEDVWLLAQHFLDEYRRRLGRPPATISPDVQAALSSYRWPGNVRELRNVMERAAILGDGEMLRRRDLPEEIAAPVGEDAVELEPDLTLAELEKRYILETLRRSGGNQTRAGQKLGISARTLYNKLQKWGIEPGTG